MIIITTKNIKIIIIITVITTNNVKYIVCNSYWNNIFNEPFSRPTERKTYPTGHSLYINTHYNYNRSLLYKLYKKLMYACDLFEHLFCFLCPVVSFFYTIFRIFSLVNCTAWTVLSVYNIYVYCYIISYNICMGRF